MTTLIEAVSDSAPAVLTELRRLGRTLKQRAADVLAYFDRPGTSNGPTQGQFKVDAPVTGVIRL